MHDRRTARRWPVWLILVGWSLITGAGTLGAQRQRSARAGQPAAAPAPDSTRFGGMWWRTIGPFRGGRADAVTGVRGQPLVYYFGSTGGGVWKTEDGGQTWRNISDGYVNTASVGAIAVAESDPNVLYLGMGEHPVRGVTTSHGDGIYKSTDAGKTWTHSGLELSRAISRIRIHPRNPDLVYVAVQGAPYAPTKERGIYRSRDGGTTWEQVLYVGETAGASDLSMDRTNPRVLYASFWDHLRQPWEVRSGGPGSGIWKSTDGGDSWEQINEGLPSLKGKIGVDVSGADPERVYAIVESEPNGGLYRSDDAGKHWRVMNTDRSIRARSWYYMEVFADPQNADVVYVMDAPFMKSIDGGKTFSSVRVPHGDNHDLWINPDDDQIMINADDGGATVSFTGGRTWTAQDNQPTAQFYRVNTDHRFPYWVYGGQQDNSSVAILSRGPGGGIDWKDWHDVGGCESAYAAFDPDDPTLVYAGCYMGIITEWNTKTATERDVMAYPFFPAAWASRDMKYRFNWNAPILVSRHNPRVIYHGANILLKSENRGRTWTEISPDLTRDDSTKQGPGGRPITVEGAGGEIYGTIFYIAESPRDARIIWTGSDDGVISLTRDGGAHWSNVTPKGMPEAQINAIEVSPHDAGTAYAAVTRYKFNDFTPHIYKTTDDGQSWREITNGIAPDHWVRVVREDPLRRGLLYAGTELGMYISFDGGEHWQPWQLNLPIVPVTDLQVHGNDLVAATQGRAFWILDDLSPVRQFNDSLAAQPAHLYRPADAYRLAGGGGFSFNRSGVGQNPPNGAIIYYSLRQSVDSATPATLEVLDSAGAVVRRYSTQRSGFEEPASPPEGGGGPGSPPAPRLPGAAGLNRFVWDLRYERPVRIPGFYVFGPFQGRRVVPGAYQVRLTVGGQTQTQSFRVLKDPRLDVSPRDFIQQDSLVVIATHELNDVHRAVLALRSMRDQINDLLKRVADQPGADTVEAAGKAFVSRLDAAEDSLIQKHTVDGQSVINFPARLNQGLITVIDAVDGADDGLTDGARRRHSDLAAEWQRLKGEVDRLLGGELDQFNALVRDRGIPAVVRPAGEGTRPIPD